MVKNKDSAKEGGSKKRKADTGVVAESSSKKARHEPASPVVKLPHTPNGTVPAQKAKLSEPTKPGTVAGTSQPPPDPTVNAKDSSKPAKKKKKKRASTANQDVAINDVPTQPQSTNEQSAQASTSKKQKKRGTHPMRAHKRAKAVDHAGLGNVARTDGDDRTLANGDVDVEGSTTGLSKMARRRRNKTQKKAMEAGNGDAGSVPDAVGGETGAAIIEANTKVDAAMSSTKQRKLKPKKAKGEGGVDDGSVQDHTDIAPKQHARKDKRTKKTVKSEEERKGQHVDHEAFGSKELDREVDMLDVEALEKREAAEAEAMGIIKRPASAKPSDWSLSSSMGGRFIDHDPIFTSDPKTGDSVLIAATQREIQVLLVETSLPLRTHALRPGLGVSSYAIDGKHSESLHVVCDNGAVFSWDWTVEDAEPRLLHTADAYFVTRASADAESHGLLYLKDVDHRGAIWSNKSMYTLKTLNRRLRGMVVLGDGEYVVAYGTSTLVLGMRVASQDYAWVEVPIDGSLTCMDARLTHTEGSSKKDKRRAQIGLALGFFGGHGYTGGHIHLYDDVTSLFTQQGQPTLPPSRTLHWHRDAVSAVKFSRDGRYLISGGKETVLVLWQLDTGNKQLLPHLTSEIERIVVSPEGDRYALQMGDNSIMVLSTSELKPVANFAGLQMACPFPGLSKKQLQALKETRKSMAAVLHPRQLSQVLLAVPASQPKVQTEAAESRPFLQTFDLRTSRHVTRQALTRNNVTDFNLGPEQTPIAPPDVTVLAISHDGQWLATIDEWMPPANDVMFLSTSDEAVQEERVKRREVYLKFWQWDDVHNVWTLSTRVDAPHARAGKSTQGAGRVLALVAAPISASFATLGEDGKVRTWKPKTRVRHGVAMKAGGDTDIVEWSCRRTIGLPAESDGRADSHLDADSMTEAPLKGCLAYSEDGSMLAAALTTSSDDERSVVRLLDMASGDIKASKGGVTPGPLRHVGFLDRYLITVATDQVQVWDLITDTMESRHTISKARHSSAGPPIFAVNSADGTFAIAVGARVTVYKTTARQHVYQEKFHQDLVALLATKGSKGYTLLIEDATVRKLVPTGALRRRELPSAPTAAETTSLVIQPAVTQADSADDVEMADMLALPAAESRGPVFHETEDDRPVVRPEQLAEVFDVGQSFAMPPVKNMFEAVMGLYGRRPLAQVAVAG